MRTYGIVACSCALFVVACDARAASYSAQGSFTYTTSDLPAGAGGAEGGKLIVPDGDGPYPLVIASHGWSASEANQEGWAQQFASWGYVVVVPTFPNALTPDTAVNAGIIEALVAMYQIPPAGSPAEGKVDPLRLALEGHSAGGLATAVAASVLEPQATILFDPVDSSDAGKSALPGICGPLLQIFAEPSSCNDSEGWQEYAATSSGPQVLFSVIGSTHCDGENFARDACGPFCGGAADATRQAEYARYATAMLEAYLKGSAEAEAELTIGALTADTALAGVAVFDADDCAGVGGASDVGSDAGPDGDADSDSGSDSDSDSDSDADSDSDSDSDAVSDMGLDGGDVSNAVSCGCDAVGRGIGRGPLSLVLESLFF
jgi:dienelactone hydrolase